MEAHNNTPQTRSTRPPLTPRLGSGDKIAPPRPATRSQSRPRTPARRDSNETTGRSGQARQILSPVPTTMPMMAQKAGSTRAHSTRGTPPPLPSRTSPRGSSPSVLSGREGSTFSRRGETITSPPPQELELFAQHCRLFYFSQSPPEASAQYISSALAALPPAHRAAYTRIQSQLRSQAHVHHHRVRISSFHALMASTVPSGSLSLPARSDLGGQRAKAERAERLGHFIRTWGNNSGGALLPFFRGLWAVMRVQSRGAKNGGAGPRRVVWEVDDAVFLEIGGPEFMHEAVAVIKGVLGFDDQPLTTPPKLRFRDNSADDARNRSGSDPFTDKRTPGQSPSKQIPPQPRKGSAGRGPAPPPPVSRRKAAAAAANQTSPSPSPSSSPLSPSPGASPLHGPNEDRQLLLPIKPSHSPLALEPVSPGSDADSLDSRSVDLEAEEADLNQPRFRVWTFPAHIGDEEAVALLSLFPRCVAREDSGRRIDPRLRPGKAPAPRAKDLELGLVSGSAAEAWTAISVDGVEVRIPRPEREEDAGVVRCGTGRMWVGPEDRRGNWRGGAWFRFKRWWKRLFGLA